MKEKYSYPWLFLNFIYSAVLLFQVGVFCLPALVLDFRRTVWPVTSILYSLYLNRVHTYYYSILVVYSILVTHISLKHKCVIIITAYCVTLYAK
jgi:hypothetical protein